MIPEPFLSKLSTDTNNWKVLEEFLTLHRQLSSIVDLLGAPANWDHSRFFFWVLAAFLFGKVIRAVSKQNKTKQSDFSRMILPEYFNILQGKQSILLKQTTEPVCQGETVPE